MIADRIRKTMEVYAMRGQSSMGPIHQTNRERPNPGVLLLGLRSVVQPSFHPPSPSTQHNRFFFRASRRKEVERLIASRPSSFDPWLCCVVHVPSISVCSSCGGCPRVGCHSTVMHASAICD